MKDNVITFSQKDWDTMLLLKQSIGWYQKQNNDKYQTALEREKELLKDYTDRKLGRRMEQTEYLQPLMEAA